MSNKDRWLDLAIELQSISQIGLTYSRDDFDTERYSRIREISAEMISIKTDLDVKKVYELFCNETGYQTPKIDTRAAIFNESKILLVKERNERWSLPGGWCDVNQSVSENIIKEVREESGYNVNVEYLIAVQDRNKHNTPKYAYGICKIFFACSIIDGEFTQNLETTEIDFFSLDNLPELSVEKSSLEQIEMCFKANEALNWKTLFD